MTLPFAKLRDQSMADPAFREAYDAFGLEFDLKRALIQARMRAGPTQGQLAERMHTTAAVIARLESGRVRSSTLTLERFARATGTRLKISFEPAEAGPVVS